MGDIIRSVVLIKRGSNWNWTYILNRLNTTIALYIFICFFIVFCSACEPATQYKNPQAYELYLTISSDQTPAVSRDGEWIAYFHQDLTFPENENYPTGLYKTRIDNFDPILLLEGRHFQPCWSPDDKWIVFSSMGLIQIIDSKGDSLRTLAGFNELPLFYPDWSKDGNKIIFCSPYIEGGGGFVCTPDLQNARQLFSHYQFNAYPIIQVNDSLLIGCLYSTDWIGEDLVLCDTSFNVLSRLTNDNKSDRHPSYSEQRESIVWSRNVQIYIMGIDGSNIEKIDYGQYPSWPYDGNYFCYSNAISDFSKEVIWRYNLNNKSIEQITGKTGQTGSSSHLGNNRQHSIVDKYQYINNISTMIF